MPTGVLALRVALLDWEGDAVDLVRGRASKV